MGGAFEMLAVAVGSGGAATALARALTSWLQTRRPDVSVTVTKADRSVTFRANDLDAGAVMPLLRQVLNSDGSDGNVAD
jgi:cysteine synthase